MLWSVWFCAELSALLDCHQTFMFLLSIIINPVTPCLCLKTTFCGFFDRFCYDAVARYVCVL